MTPDVILHATAGGVGLLSGAVALFARKGERLHRAAGNVFFVSMTLTAAGAVYLGFKVSEIGNAIGGVLTIYMLATAWMTVRRKERQIGLFEPGAFLLAAAGSATGYFFAIQSLRDGTAFMGGIPALTFASVVAFAAMLDLSVLLRRGLAGRQRIARHVWRMHMGYFTAVGSFFPGQLQIFPEFIREIRPIILLFTPPFAVVALMLFWLAVVLFTKRFKSAAPQPSA